jgi:hypothetical protein
MLIYGLTDFAAQQPHLDTLTALALSTRRAAGALHPLQPQPLQELPPSPHHHPCVLWPPALPRIPGGEAEGREEDIK